MYLDKDGRQAVRMCPGSVRPRRKPKTASGNTSNNIIVGMHRHFVRCGRSLNLHGYLLDVRV
jgi:hypothetical protein